MLKLYILCAFAAVVRTFSMKDLVGTWYSVEFFPSLYDEPVDVSECHPHILDNNSGKKYKCDGKMTESVSYSFSGITVVSPVIFVSSHEEALRALDKEYTCEGISAKPTVFEILDKDHFVSYVGKKRQEPFSLYRLLFSRTIPRESDLNAYVKTVADLKNITGDIVCTVNKLSTMDFTHTTEGLIST